MVINSKTIEYEYIVYVDNKTFGQRQSKMNGTRKFRKPNSPAFYVAENQRNPSVSMWI